MGRSRLLKLGIVTSVLGTAVLGAAGSANAVSGATPADPTAQPFLAKVQIAEQRACSGALVAPQWVLTTRSCLAEPSSSAEGAPPAGTKVTLIGGHTQPVTWVRPHPERDLALLRLAKRTRGITTAAIAATVPASGAELRAAGFGRTADVWVPQTAHLGAFTVTSVNPATLDIDSTSATLCLGDTGAPLLNPAGQIAGVASASWQGGCLAVTETRRGGVAQRVDDLGAWVRANTPDMCASPGHSTTTNDQPGFIRMADFTGDCAVDLAGVFGTDLRVNRASGRMDADRAAYPGTLRARTGISPTGVQRIITGDFNGDGKADLGLQWITNGELRLYGSTGDFSEDKLFDNGMVYGPNWSSANVQRILTGDFNGDGVTDIAAQLPNGSIRVDLLTRGRMGQKLQTQIVTRVGGYGSDYFPKLFTGDFNGDGRTDILGQTTNGILRAYAATGNMSGNWFEGSGRDISKPDWKVADSNRVLIGDFNGDGTDDVAVEDGGPLRIYDMGRNWASVGQPTAFGDGFGSANVVRLSTGDVNGDGRDEILANYASTGDIRIFQPRYGSGVLAISSWTTGTVRLLL